MIKIVGLEEMMDPILKAYERQATYYDRMSGMMDFALEKARSVLATLWGEILEVGVGTGKNLPYYSHSSHVTALDWSSQMVDLARLRVRQLGLAHVKTIRVGDVQDLHWISPASFDFVTSSCVFCSVPDPVRGLREIKRILRPSGYLVQIEHGISKVYLLNGILRLLDPVVVRMNGAHLTRDHMKNIYQAGFEIVFNRELDPAGLTRIIVSRPSKTNPP